MYYQISNVVQLAAGMRLEAKDRKNPNLTCVATIDNFDDDGNVLIHFDGWGETFDYFAAITNEDLHPVGYCEHAKLKLQAPGCKLFYTNNKFKTVQILVADKIQSIL